MSMDDLDFIALQLADPEVMRYYPKCYSREESAQWIDRILKRYERDGHGMWLVENRETSDPVGQVGLLTQQIDGESLLEIGYLIHRPYWRQGLAFEAASGVRDHAFNSLNATHLVSLIRPENIPSQGVATKVGMHRENRVVQHGSFDHWVFSLDRSE